MSLLHSLARQDLPVDLDLLDISSRGDFVLLSISRASWSNVCKVRHGQEVLRLQSQVSEMLITQPECGKFVFAIHLAAPRRVYICIIDRELVRQGGDQMLI